jgi:hypothetical protein
MEKIAEDTYKVKALHKDFIGIYEEALSKEKCQEIINKIEGYIKNNPSEITNGNNQFKNKDIGRKDFSIFTSRVFSEISKDVNEILNVYINAYADEFFVLRNIGHIRSEEVKLQKTPPKGGYHVWHCEHGFGKGYADRVLAWTIYLNDIPDGEGETEFLWQGVRIKPKAGTLSIFPAAFTHTHRGNPVYSCDKYIATGWYCFAE